MLLTIYLVLLSLTITFIVLGLWRADDFWELAGYALLFSLGLLLMLGNVTYEHGAVIKTTYTYDAPVNGTLNETQETTTPIEVSFTDGYSRSFGFITMSLGLLAFILRLIRNAEVRT